MIKTLAIVLIMIGGGLNQFKDKKKQRKNLIIESLMQ